MVYSKCQSRIVYKLNGITTISFLNLPWCSGKKIQTPLKQMSLSRLDTNLRRFYAEARKKSGDVYSKSILLSFRHGIERYLNTQAYSRSLTRREIVWVNASLGELKRDKETLSSPISCELKRVKGAVSRCFSATFDIAGLKPWLSTIAHTRNAPRTSRERYHVKYWRKRELQFILGYFFKPKWQKLKNSTWIFQV